MHVEYFQRCETSTDQLLDMHVEYSQHRPTMTNKFLDIYLHYIYTASHLFTLF